MKFRGALIATAALGLLAADPSTALAEEGKGGKVKCDGGNSCGGKGECAAADGSHDCAGKNGCGGKGWIYTDTAEECTEKGGTAQD